MSKNRLILHPTDFSVGSLAAFDVACSLARDQKAKLIILHVAPLPVTLDEVAATRKPGYRDDLRAELQKIRPANPQIEAVYLLAEGDPENAILNAATDHVCDLIVMGTHGRTGLGRLLMGSVAEHVVRKATCPVLTVRSPNAIKVAD
jgi:nucleotide-binding universal stress UspA family protein